MTINTEALKAAADQRQYRVGTKAYYDTFAGLVPCKVVEIRRKSYGFQVRHSRNGDLLIAITETRGGYKKGERLEVSAHNVVPTRHVRNSKLGQIRLNACYVYIP